MIFSLLLTGVRPSDVNTGELPAELLKKASVNKTNTNYTSQPVFTRTQRIVIIRGNKTLHVFVCNQITSSPSPAVLQTSPFHHHHHHHQHHHHTSLFPSSLLLGLIPLYILYLCWSLKRTLSVTSCINISTPTWKTRLFVSVYFFAFDLGACTSIDLAFISPL